MAFLRSVSSPLGRHSRRWFTITGSEKSDLKILGFGNPRLDITVFDSSILLNKYGLVINRETVIGAGHRTLFNEIRAMNPPPRILAGGRTQNSMRVAQWILQTPESVGFVGSIGCDEEGELLTNAAEASGLRICYQLRSGERTGTRATFIDTKFPVGFTEVSDPGASVHFTTDILRDPSIYAMLMETRLIFVGGYLWISSPKTVMKAAQFAAEHKKAFVMSLQNPIVIPYFASTNYNILQYIDYLFGNGSDALALARALGSSNLPYASQFKVFRNVEEPDTSVLIDIARKVAALPKEGCPSSTRRVFFTNSAKPLVYCDGSLNYKVDTMKAIDVSEEEILDRKGCGDAFCGGFLAQMAIGEDMNTALRCGFYATKEVIKNYGCSLPDKPNFS